MKPFIDKARCVAEPAICPPIKECPEQAITFVEDAAQMKAAIEEEVGQEVRMIDYTH